MMLSRTAWWWWTVTGDGRNVRKEHLTLPLSLLRLMDPDQIQLATDVAQAWYRLALVAADPAAGPTASKDATAEVQRLSTSFEEVILLTCVGATESDVSEFLAKASFVDV
jgi:hypothetical protein